MSESAINEKQFFVTQIFELCEKAGLAICLIDATRVEDMNVAQLARRWNKSTRTILSYIESGKYGLKLNTPSERKKGRELVVNGLSIQMAERNHGETFVKIRNI